MKTRVFLTIALVVVIALISNPTAVYACGNSKNAGVEKIKVGTVPTEKSRANLSAATGENDEAVSEDQATLVTFAVKGMTCNGCEGQVRTALLNQTGVTEVVEISHKADRAVVRYDSDKVKVEELASVVEDAGFTAEVIPAVSTAGNIEKKSGKEKTEEM